jgi:hypothetical protein
MFKELRELISFVLGLLTDTFELVRMSVLSRSSSIGLGREAATALHLSASVIIILISIFISVASAARPQLEWLPFSVLCLVYFTTVSFLIYALMRHFRGELWAVPAGSLPAKDEKTRVWDGNIDAKSYVLAFNLVALFVFAIVRETLLFQWGTATSLGTVNAIAAVPAVVVAGFMMLVLARKEESPVSSGLNFKQRALIATVLTASFLLYITLVVSR